MSKKSKIKAQQRSLNAEKKANKVVAGIMIGIVVLMLIIVVIWSVFMN